MGWEMNDAQRKMVQECRRESILDRGIPLGTPLNERQSEARPKFVAIKMGRQPVCRWPKCLRPNEPRGEEERGFVVASRKQEGSRRGPDVDCVGRRRPPETPNQFVTVCWLSQVSLGK